MWVFSYFIFSSILVTMFKMRNFNPFKTGVNKKRIYLDYAAATPVREEVSEAMRPYWNENFGNPGAIHQEGVVAKKAIQKSRKKIANVLKCLNDEIIFTSSGTESNNLAIFGLIEKLLEEGADLKDLHLITTVMEHPSILDLFKKYEKKGVQVSYINIDKNGMIDLKEFREALKSNTVLVSVMYVNNEIGIIQPISKIAHILRVFRNKNNELKVKFPTNLKSDFHFPLFHTDASQAPLYLPLDIHSLGVDMMTVDGQKIYGPKGVGILYKKRDVKINSLLVGGNQEMGYRAGTENVPLIVSLGKAIELANKERKKESERLVKLRNYFIDKILKEIEGAVLNGGREGRLPNNVNVSIPNIDSEFMIIKLDNKGISCASKSACMGAKAKESYVIDALCGSGAGSALRFTMGKETTKKDIDFVVEVIKKSV